MEPTELIYTLVLSTPRRVIVCERCGDEIPVPEGTEDWFAGVVEAFGRAHANCNGIGGKTGFDRRSQFLAA